MVGTTSCVVAVLRCLNFVIGDETAWPADVCCF